MYCTSAIKFDKMCILMNEQLILKNKLKDARTEYNLSQSQLAEMVGVSRNTISSIETGQFNPTAKLALILCIALDKFTKIRIYSML
jgi:putative transcriptional regulator